MRIVQTDSGERTVSVNYPRHCQDRLEGPAIYIAAVYDNPKGKFPFILEDSRLDLSLVS